MPMNDPLVSYRVVVEFELQEGNSDIFHIPDAYHRVFTTIVNGISSQQSKWPRSGRWDITRVDRVKVQG